MVAQNCLQGNLDVTFYKIKPQEKSKVVFLGAPKMRSMQWKDKFYDQYVIPVYDCQEKQVKMLQCGKGLVREIGQCLQNSGVIDGFLISCILSCDTKGNNIPNYRAAICPKSYKFTTQEWLNCISFFEQKPVEPFSEEDFISCRDNLTRRFLAETNESLLNPGNWSRFNPENPPEHVVYVTDFVNEDGEMIVFDVSNHQFMIVSEDHSGWFEDLNCSNNLEMKWLNGEYSDAPFKTNVVRERFTGIKEFDELCHAVSQTFDELSQKRKEQRDIQKELRRGIETIDNENNLIPELYSLRTAFEEILAQKVNHSEIDSWIESAKRLMKDFTELAKIQDCISKLKEAIAGVAKYDKTHPYYPGFVFQCTDMISLLCRIENFASLEENELNELVGRISEKLSFLDDLVNDNFDDKNKPEYDLRVCKTLIQFIENEKDWIFKELENLYESDKLSWDEYIEWQRKITPFPGVDLRLCKHSDLLDLFEVWFKLMQEFVSLRFPKDMSSQANRYIPRTLTLTDDNDNIYCTTADSGKKSVAVKFDKFANSTNEVDKLQSGWIVYYNHKEQERLPIAGLCKPGSDIEKVCKTIATKEFGLWILKKYQENQPFPLSSCYERFVNETQSKTKIKAMSSSLMWEIAHPDGKTEYITYKYVCGDDVVSYENNFDQFSSQEFCDWLLVRFLEKKSLYNCFQEWQKEIRCKFHPVYNSDQTIDKISSFWRIKNERGRITFFVGCFVDKRQGVVDTCEKIYEIVSKPEFGEFLFKQIEKAYHENWHLNYPEIYTKFVEEFGAEKYTAKLECIDSNDKHSYSWVLLDKSGEEYDSSGLGWFLPGCNITEEALSKHWDILTSQAFGDYYAKHQHKYGNLENLFEDYLNKEIRKTGEWTALIAGDFSDKPNLLLWKVYNEKNDYVDAFPFSTLTKSVDKEYIESVFEELGSKEFGKWLANRVKNEEEISGCFLEYQKKRHTDMKEGKFQASFVDDLVNRNSRADYFWQIHHEYKSLVKKFRVHHLVGSTQTHDIDRAWKQISSQEFGRWLANEVKEKGPHATDWFGCYNRWLSEQKWVAKIEPDVKGREKGDFWIRVYNEKNELQNDYRVHALFGFLSFEKGDQKHWDKINSQEFLTWMAERVKTSKSFRFSEWIRSKMKIKTKLGSLDFGVIQTNGQPELVITDNQDQILIFTMNDFGPNLDLEKLTSSEFGKELLKIVEGKSKNGELFDNMSFDCPKIYQEYCETNSEWIAEIDPVSKFVVVKDTENNCRLLVFPDIYNFCDLNLLQNQEFLNYFASRCKEIKDTKWVNVDFSEICMGYIRQKNSVTKICYADGPLYLWHNGGTYEDANGCFDVFWNVSFNSGNTIHLLTLKAGTNEENLKTLSSKEYGLYVFQYLKENNIDNVQKLGQIDWIKLYEDYEKSQSTSALTSTSSGYITKEAQPSSTTGELSIVSSKESLGDQLKSDVKHATLEVAAQQVGHALVKVASKFTEKNPNSKLHAVVESPLGEPALLALASVVVPKVTDNETAHKVAAKCRQVAVTQGMGLLVGAAGHMIPKIGEIFSKLPDPKASARRKVGQQAPKVYVDLHPEHGLQMMHEHEAPQEWVNGKPAVKNNVAKPTNQQTSNNNAKTNAK